MLLAESLVAQACLLSWLIVSAGWVVQKKAIELGRSDEARSVDAETAIELAIVVAGARQDLGQNDAAVVALQRANPSMEAKGIPAMRLSYAYAHLCLKRS